MLQLFLQAATCVPVVVRLSDRLAACHNVQLQSKTPPHVGVYQDRAGYSSDALAALRVQLG